MKDSYVFLCIRASWRSMGFKIIFKPLSWKMLKQKLELRSPNSFSEGTSLYLCFHTSFSSSLKCQTSEPFLTSPEITLHYSLVFLTLRYLHFSLHLAVCDIMLCMFLAFFFIVSFPNSMQTLCRRDLSFLFTEDCDSAQHNN